VPGVLRAGKNKRIPLLASVAVNIVCIIVIISLVTQSTVTQSLKVKYLKSQEKFYADPHSTTIGLGVAEWTTETNICIVAIHFPVHATVHHKWIIAHEISLTNASFDNPDCVIALHGSVASEGGASQSEPWQYFGNSGLFIPQGTTLYLNTLCKNETPDLLRYYPRAIIYYRTV